MRRRAFLGLAMLAGCGAPATPLAVPSAAPPPARPGPVRPDPAVRPAPPVRLRIPAIGVDAAVVEIRVGADGALVPPTGGDVVGWYAAGPAPGEAGPALLAGHVDTRSGPAVLYALQELVAGDRVEVDRSGAATSAFVVGRTYRTPKARFPTDDVYAPTPASELRLVTCGGTFDRAVGHYRDNVVVEAVAADPGWTVVR